MSLAYDEYLKSDEWRFLRKRALDRANGNCEFCGDSGKEVHHVKYPKHMSDDEIDNLVVTCARCHRLCHGIREKSQEELWQEELHEYYVHPDSSSLACLINKRLVELNRKIRADIQLTDDESWEHELLVYSVKGKTYTELWYEKHKMG